MSLRFNSKLMILSCLLLMVSSCSLIKPDKHQFLEGDGLPEGKQLDLSKITDAVPKKEVLSKTGNKPYTVFGEQYHPLSKAENFHEYGRASWYGTKFHGRTTSSGEPYDMYSMTAAHRTLPLPSYVRVTNQANGSSVVVKVNDRGPFVDTDKRVIDLSYAAAAKLGMIGTGTAQVLLEGIDLTELKAPVVSESDPEIKETIRLDKLKEKAAIVGLFYVQVGAFTQADNVKKLKQDLASHQISSFIDKPGDLYKVKVGPFETAEQALSRKLDVDRAIGPGAILIKE